MKAEYTLQECIKYFNESFESFPFEKVKWIRRMEVLSEWRTAAEYWTKIGYHSDANACIMIAEATERGDRHREATAHLYRWVDETVERGIMEKDEAIKFIYPEIQRIHSQIL